VGDVGGGKGDGTREKGRFGRWVVVVVVEVVVEAEVGEERARRPLGLIPRTWPTGIVGWISRVDRDLAADTYDGSISSRTVSRLVSGSRKIGLDIQDQRAPLVPSSRMIIKENTGHAEASASWTYLVRGDVARIHR
jgi:phage gp37-like protein